VNKGSSALGVNFTACGQISFQIKNVELTFVIQHFQVHLQLAKYHEACRFTDDGTYDKMAAFFHLKSSAECSIVVAQVPIFPTSVRFR
jgi:hypothetical protein